MDILSDNVVQLVNIVRGLMRQDNQYLPPTWETVVKLRLMMIEVLGEELKDYRKDVLRTLTGLPIPHQKNLTQHTHSVLIDIAKKEYQDELRAIANECKRCREVENNFRPEGLYNGKGFVC